MKQFILDAAHTKDMRFVACGKARRKRGWTKEAISYNVRKPFLESWEWPHLFQNLGFDRGPMHIPQQDDARAQEHSGKDETYHN